MLYLRVMSSKKGQDTSSGGSCHGRRSRFVPALAVVIFILPLVMWPGLTDYNYAKCVVGLIAISILLVMWGAGAWKEHRWTLHTPHVYIACLAFILAGALSAISASSGRVIAQSLALVTYFILLSWMIADAVRDRRDVVWILTALLMSGALASFYGLLQVAGIVEGSPGHSGVSAIISTMGNRNHLGGFLLYLFYPGVVVLLAARSRWVKVLALLALALGFTMMLVVRQAATQVAFPLVTGCLVLIWCIFRPTEPIRANKGWLLGLAGIICAISVVSILPPTSVPTSASTSVRTSVSTAMPNVTSQSEDAASGGSRIPAWLSSLWEANSGQERAWFWRIGGQMLADHPITGVGLGNYKLDFFRHQTAVASAGNPAPDIARVSQAHSELVQVGAELGSVGLFTLLCVLGTLAVSLWSRLKHADEQAQTELIFLCGGILAFLIHGLVSFPGHVVGSSLALVVFCGLALSPRYGSSLTSMLHVRQWKAKAVHAALIAVAVTVSLLTVADARANWLMERGLSHVQAGNVAAGEVMLQRSLELDFAPRQTYYYLAVAQIQLGKLEEAQGNLERCMRLFLDTSVTLTYSELLVDMQEPALAQSVLNTVLPLCLQSADEQRARYLGGRIAVLEKEYDRAITLFEALAQDYPKYEMSFVALGQIYAGLGASGLARDNFSTAIRLLTHKLTSIAGTSCLVTDTQQNTTEVELLTRQLAYLREQLDALI